MIAVTVPTRGLMEPFFVMPTMPVRYYDSKPGWRKYDLIKYVPGRLFVSNGNYDPEVIDDFLAQRSGAGIGLTQLPWKAWQPPLATWLPLIFTITVALIALAMVVHKQWAHHERLRYPIALFATSLMEFGPGGGPAPIFRNKLFWLGLIIAVSIRTINGIQVWYPSFIQIPLRFDFTQVLQKFPFLSKLLYAQDIFIPRIFPTAVAFTFFLSSDIALSLGLAQPLFVAMGLFLVSRGVNMTSDNIAGGGYGDMRTGACLAFGLMLIYLGRRYYGRLFLATFTGVRREGIERYAVWANRIGILATVLSVYLLSRLNVPWTMALPLILMILLYYVVVARVSAETGLFYMLLFPMAIAGVMNFFGFYATGIATILVGGMLCAITCLNTSVNVLPYLTNGLQICDQAGANVGKVGFGSIGVWILALVVALPVALLVSYNYGMGGYAWTYKDIPEGIFNAGARAATSLSLANQLQASSALTPLQRWMHINPMPGFIAFAGSGFVLVLLFGILRLRFNWWPLHPVIFLIWATHPMKRLWPPSSSAGRSRRSSSAWVAIPPTGIPAA